MRSRVGESLRTIQNARTLDKVTTPSLPALQKYVAAMHVLEFEGDWSKGQALLEEAIALDTGFAMAYRKLAVESNNRGLSPERSRDLITKAYAHRDRLSDAERYLTTAGYYSYGPEPDLNKVISAYESLLDLDSTNVTALNNLSVQLQLRHDYTRSLALATRATQIDSSAIVFFANMYSSQVALGRLDDAKATLSRMDRLFSKNPDGAMGRTDYAVQTNNYDSAVAIADSLRRARPNDTAIQAQTQLMLAALSLTRGRLVDASRWWQQGERSSDGLGERGESLALAANEASAAVWFLGDTSKALSMLDRALAERPLDSIPLLSRPYVNLVAAFSRAGKPDRARSLLAGFDRSRAASRRSFDGAFRHAMLADIALAERNFDQAIDEARFALDSMPCRTCVLPVLAQAYDLSGNADSAAAVFARYLDTPDTFRYIDDGFTLRRRPEATR